MLIVAAAAKAGAVKGDRLGRKTGRRGCWCRLAGQTGNEPPCSNTGLDGSEQGGPSQRHQGRQLCNMDRMAAGEVFRV